MTWEVIVQEEALDQLKWFGKKTGRRLLGEALEFLKRDPLAETKNMKTLRPNAFAERELRLLGRYRICSLSKKNRGE